MAAMTVIDLRHRVEHRPSGLTHVVDLSGLPKQVYGPRSIYWTLTGVHDMAPPPVLDPFVIGLLLPLAVAGGEVRVHGAMSRRGLFHAMRLLELRRATSPGRYRPLRILPDDLVDGPAVKTGDRHAVLAFSGGLDSTHAALRHARGDDRPDRLDLAALVMAHGFDAALDRPDIFARMLERAAPLADRIGVPLRAVETNSKLLQANLWPQTATPLAAAMLALFRPIARYGIFGGGLPTSTNFLSLGHQPLFDQHCSGAGFTLVTDATGLTRTQKLRNIGADSEALHGLRVCWQGPDVSRNCGRCNKCTLTKLNMRMAGLDERLAFDTPLDLDRLRATTPKTLYDARDVGEYTWRDVRADPRLPAEAEAVRQVLAAIPPVSLAGAVGAAVWDLILPPRIRALLLVPGRARRRLARTVRRAAARG